MSAELCITVLALAGFNDDVMSAELRIVEQAAEKGGTATLVGGGGTFGEPVDTFDGYARRCAALRLCCTCVAVGVAPPSISKPLMG